MFDVGFHDPLGIARIPWTNSHPIIALQNFDLFSKLAFNKSFGLYDFFKTLSFVFLKIT
jgi:hypothetical protein